MKIRSKNAHVIEHGKVNLPDVGIVDVPENGEIEVSDELGVSLVTEAQESWEAVDDQIQQMVDVMNRENKADEDAEDRTKDGEDDRYQDLVLDQEDIDENPIFRKWGLAINDIIGLPLDAEYRDHEEDDDNQEFTEEDQEQADKDLEEAKKDGIDGSAENIAEKEKTAEELQEIRRDLLKKKLPELQTIASALEMPLEEYKMLTKPQLVDYLVEQSKTNME